MVIGIPNSGKSSLINRLSGGKRAKVEDRPGVTRGKQWIAAYKNLELLDMPGVLWAKFEQDFVAKNLAFTGAIKDDVLDIEGLSVELLSVLSVSYRGLIERRYNLSDTAELSPVDLFYAIGKSRGFLLPGNEIDTLRTATAVIDEFRGGKLGGITLEPITAL
jgi:ribosome biogenesis GTPase A